MKKRLYELLMDQEHVTSLSVGSLSRSLDATPEELMELARDHDVLDSVDKAWSILLMLAAPAAVATLRDNLQDEDSKVRQQAAREILGGARLAARHQVEQLKTGVLAEAQKKKRAPHPKDTKDIADIVQRAHRLVHQKGTSSSSEDGEDEAGGE